MLRALDGSILARAPGSLALRLNRHGPRYCNIFPYLCIMCGFEKLELVVKNLLKRDLSALFVSRRQQSGPIGVTLDIICLCDFLRSVA